MPKAKVPSRARAGAAGAPRFAIAIMAAGKGTRIKSRHPKVLHRIGGKALLEHVIAAAQQVVPPEDIFCIIGHEADRVADAVRHTGVQYVLQPEQRGTGDALARARQALLGYDQVLVLSGDVPLIRTATLERLRDFHIAEAADMTVLTTVPPDPTGYGRIVRKRRSGRATVEIERIVEHGAASSGERRIGEINSGIYAFRVPALYAHIGELTAENPSRELYLTDIAGIFARHKLRVLALGTDHATEVLGANSRAELAHLDAAFRMQKCRQLMEAGVTIYRPETCVIDADVQVGPDTVLEPFVQLLGRTSVGSDCQVSSYSMVFDCEVGDKVTLLPYTHIRESRVRSGARLGPYTNLRPGCDVGEDAHIGNFVEMKKTRIGRGSKANHLTYLGDTTVGDKTNIGAGTITCNYDGTGKYPTAIGSGTFVGSDSILVAPITIGDGAYVAAASCLTEDVPADALAIGRARQINKPGWAREKREAKAKKAQP